MLQPFLAAIVIGVCISVAAPDTSASELPERTGPQPRTTDSVPHVQIGVERKPDLIKSILSRVARLPGVDIRPTVVSLPGAKGFWLNEEIALAHPEVIVGGREFAHMHPDGSLHASLAPQRAKQAVRAGWAVPHPWSNRRKGWEGFVMIYSPSSERDSKIIFQLVVDSYNFVTGRTVMPDD